MTELVVRHEFSTVTLIVGFVVALCVGGLCGVVISHDSAIDNLRDRVTLNETWVRTHRHPAPGEQPETPEETKDAR